MKRYMIACILPLLLAACSNDENKIYETVAPTVYFSEPGLVDMTGKDWSEEFEAWVYRAGNTTYSIDIDIVVRTSALVSYNVKNGVSYGLLPEICYSLPQNRKNISGENYLVAFEITFDTQALNSLPSGYYMLPLGLSSSRAYTNADKDTLIFLFHIP